MIFLYICWTPIFYAFKVEQQWKDVSPNANNINLTEHFKNLSLTVFKMILFLQREETIMEITALQWQQLNQSCKTWFNTKQSMQDIEKREKVETITLNALKDAGAAPDMQLVYGFVPKDGTLEKMIDRKARVLAARIVLLTSNTIDAGRPGQFRYTDKESH